MKTFISLLRGVNIGGKNPLRMTSLKDMFENMGFRDVRTYIQSGNVVFSSVDLPAENLEEKISLEILKRFSYNIPVMVMERYGLQAILDWNPFISAGQYMKDKLCIIFLSHQPAAESLERFSAGTYLPEQYSMNGKAIYVYCPNGFSRARLTNVFFENKLKVCATARNLRTLEELIRISNLI